MEVSPCGRESMLHGLGAKTQGGQVEFGSLEVLP